MFFENEKFHNTSFHFTSDFKNRNPDPRLKKPGRRTLNFL